MDGLNELPSIHVTLQEKAMSIKTHPQAETFFVLRAPGLPIEFLEAWSAEARVLGGGDVDAALDADREGLRQVLREAVADPGIREAVFLASKELEAALDPWLRKELTAEQSARVERSLVGHLSRMAFQGDSTGPLTETALGSWGSTSGALNWPAASVTLPETVRAALEEAVDTLRRLSPPRVPGPLGAFKAAFLERYEGMWAPLLEVLDPEAGIGFCVDPSWAEDEAALTEEAGLPGRTPATQKTFTPRDAYLLRKLQRLGDAVHWELDDVDLASLENPQAPPFPATFAALATLAASSATALAGGDFTVVLETFSGAEGARLLARSCQGDPRLEAKVREHVAAEEAGRPEAIFAEGIHAPAGGAENEGVRPVFRNFEILLQGTGRVPESRRILPADLLVNVVGGRVVLWSRRLKREVVPRFSGDHTSCGLTVCRFLHQLQDQEGASGSWNWGALKGASFLPRVVVGNHILCRARWRLETRELERALNESVHGVWGAFALVRQRRGLPRRVVLEDAGSPLLVDLDQALWVETLWRQVSHRDAFTLVECFPSPPSMPLQGPGGHFSPGLVVPFRCGVEPRPPLPVPRHAPASRSFSPGSEWLYARIFGGPAVADRILLEGVAPLVAATRGLWDKWFFLRNPGPPPHIGLRFHGHPDLLAGELLPWMHRTLEPLRKTGIGWRLQLDTYDRDEESYGGPAGMELAEDWFWRDSEWALQELQACQGDPDRWKKGLVDVDQILEALGLDPDHKVRAVQEGREGFLRDLGAGENLPAEMGAKFRPLAKELESLLEAGSPGANPSLKSLARLGEEARAGNLSRPLDTLAPSLAHLHLNRLLRSEHRAQECMLLDFLNRAYALMRAKA